MRPLEGEKSGGLRSQADLLSQGAKARIRAQPSQFRELEDAGKTTLVLRKRFFQIFERMLFVADAGVDLGQTAGWRGASVDALQVLLEEADGLVALSCPYIGTGKPADHTTAPVVFLEHGQRLCGSPLQVEGASQKFGRRGPSGI